MRIKLAYPLSLHEIADATNALIKPKDENRIITHITTDSREIMPGDLFIALDGKRFRGDDYLFESVKKGAIPITAQKTSVGLTVLDAGKALLDLAAFYKTKLKDLKYTVAITGSVGKTTTKEFAAILLSEKYKTHATSKNLNNTIGVPLTILSAPRNCEALVIEMGMNHSGEIERSAKCACADLSIILNVGTSHIGNLGSREGIADAKLEIKKANPKTLLIAPKREPLLARDADITFDLSSRKADIYLTKAYPEEIYFKETPFCHFVSPFTENHFKECLLATVCACISVGLSPEEITKGISKITRKNTRQNIVPVKTFYVFEDFYNASIESILASLDSLSRLQGYTRKSVLIGDVLELGDKSEEIHRDIGAKLASFNLYNVFLFGNYASFIHEGLISCSFPSKHIFINENAALPQLTANQIINNTVPGEIILMKGSRGIRLERILKHLGVAYEL